MRGDSPIDVRKDRKGVWHERLIREIGCEIGSVSDVRVIDRPDEGTVLSNPLIVFATK